MPKTLWPNRYGIFGTDIDANFREEDNSNIKLFADIKYIFIISTECGYQILVTKICNGGRLSYILTKTSGH